VTSDEEVGKLTLDRDAWRSNISSIMIVRVNTSSNMVAVELGALLLFSIIYIRRGRTRSVILII
jgi:hypothetical protein